MAEENEEEYYNNLSANKKIEEIHVDGDEEQYGQINKDIEKRFSSRLR